MTPMNTDSVLYKAESHQLIGCAFDVHNELGHGFHEKPYENALVVEFNNQEIPYQQQRCFDMVYKTVKVGEYIPDLIVFDKIIVDTKVVDKITGREIGQMMNYLRITGLRLGYILNFKHTKLEWERVIL